MSDASTGSSEQSNAGVIQVYAVGVPDILSDPPDLFRIFGRRHAIAFLAEGQILPVFRRVGM